MKSTTITSKYSKNLSQSKEIRNSISKDFFSGYMFSSHNIDKKINRAKLEKMSIDENVSSMEHQKLAEKFRRDRFMKGITYTLMKYYMVGHY